MSTFLKIILDCSRPEKGIILFFDFIKMSTISFIKMSTFQFFQNVDFCFIKMSTFRLKRKNTLLSLNKIFFDQNLWVR